MVAEQSRFILDNMEALVDIKFGPSQIMQLTEDWLWTRFSRNFSVTYSASAV